MGYFIYSNQTHSRIFHLPNCSMIRKIKKENRAKFDGTEEAIIQGYRPCRRCCPSLKESYEKHRAEITKLCKKENICDIYCEDHIDIISQFDIWRIIVVDFSFHLLHRNHSKSNNSWSMPLQGYYFQDYHVQNFASFSLLKCYKYILRHDRYRMKHPVYKMKPLNRTTHR